MQDIDVIAKVNAEAVKESIPRFLKQGKYVNAIYEGLRFADIAVFDTLEQAQGHAEATNNIATGTAVTTHTPPYLDPLAKQDQQDAALAQQAARAKPQITETEAPPVRRNLTYGAVQVVAMVVTDGKEVWPLPPHQAAAVLHDNDPKQIVALCGPISDLPSVQDAVVLAKAYELRDALSTLLYALENAPPAEMGHVVHTAQRVLDAASPVFAAVKQPSHEERLAELTKDYDPSLTPTGAGILSDDQLGSFDATPSESEPQSA